MDVSVVIPTCNRKESLLRVLNCLNNSRYPIQEVIIVDSSDTKLSLSELTAFENLRITYFESIRSVCIQRNFGIQHAKSDWIFLCDDDLGIPFDYLEKLVNHVSEHPDSGAVSGLVLQKESGQWVFQYPVMTCWGLLWRFIFQLSIWGEIKCQANNPVTRYLKNYYKLKRNHISKAGWPVLVDFSGAYFTTPLYGLGASLVKKEWIVNSPFDETLDSHGIGDHYGVALGFPGPLHISKMTCVYHYQDQTNRLEKTNQYKQRIFALHYFLKIKTIFKSSNKIWLVWSLYGNLLRFIFKGDVKFSKATIKAISTILLGSNPIVKKGRIT